MARSAKSYILAQEHSFSVLTRGINNKGRLSLEGEAGTDLVGSLVQVLGIKRSTQAEGDAGAEQDVVSQGSNTTVVDLGLI